MGKRDRQEAKGVRQMSHYRDPSVECAICKGPHLETEHTMEGPCCGCAWDHAQFKCGQFCGYCADDREKKLPWYKRLLMKGKT